MRGITGRELARFGGSISEKLKKVSLNVTNNNT